MPEATGTVTIPDVTILRPGTWAASTGPVTVTADHIADALAAFADPQIDTAPLKLGHTGKLSDLGDSEPGLGWLDNLRLADDGAVVADLVDIPASLEPAIKAGFKRRSAELAWGVTTTGGKKYSMVIDGLALLGVQRPAVKGLEDLGKLYTPATLASDGLEAESHSRLAFYDIAPDEPTRPEKIANAAEWAKESVARLAALVGVTGLQAAFDAIDAMTRTDSRGLLAAGPQSDPHAPQPPGGKPMSTTPTLSAEQLAEARTKLGLADDATDEQVVAKLSELDALVTAMRPPSAGTDAGDGGTGDGTTTGEPATAGAALSADQLQAAGLVTLPAAALAQIQADAAAGKQAATHLAEKRRDDLLDEAERAGKFGAGDAAKATRTNLAALLDTNYAGTKALIDGMPALVPVGEIGNDSPGPAHSELAAGQADAWAKWEDEVFGLTEENA